MACGMLTSARVKMADPKVKISIPAFDVASNYMIENRMRTTWVVIARFYLILVEKCTAVGIPHDGKNLKWKDLLNYSNGIQPFGLRFNYHNLSILHMNALIVSYLKHVMCSNFRNSPVNPKLKTIKVKECKHVDIPDGEFTIKPWPEDTSNIFHVLMHLICLFLVECVESRKKTNGGWTFPWWCLLIEAYTAQS
ncbi:hypothetical protein PAXRUDRAFT_27783 [Paxillus rubicundulus Ve08.2h10]|uniref:Uncharacterized protein n=1 Tax=Paxillus rubicundulus Ve08.2h10 TaxID=930991 RepID=A0A0D0CGA8_9AGAM|nr:hypothetical protein PAXRUDRAFT_27783 [Paxillus rubicundulus Ve08.2h10]